MLTYDQMKTARENRVGRLESLTALAKSEDRELTETEVNRASELKADITRMNEDMKDLFPADAAQTRADAIDRSAEFLSGVELKNGGRMRSADGQSNDDALNEQIERAAGDISKAVEGRQSIQRAITLPVGFNTTAGSHRGDPTQVNDLATYFTTTTVTGSKHDVVRFDATDGQVVAEGVAKPDIVSATLESADVVKIAGQAIVTSETLMFVGGAMTVIQDVIRQAIISGQNSEIVTLLEAEGTAIATEATPLGNLMLAQALTMYTSNTSVGILNPRNYSQLALDLAGYPQNVSLPRLVVGDTTADTGIVAAPHAVEIARTPVGVLVDPYTLADENKVRVIAEMFIAINVVRPNQVHLPDVAPVVPVGLGNS